MRAHTSRARFDEDKHFTGVFQQMGKVQLDADWNEQVRISRTTTLRHTADLTEGSPDDGYLITDQVLLRGVGSTSTWTGTGLPPDDPREVRPSLAMVRRRDYSLPKVLHSRGHVALESRFAAPLDLSSVPLLAGPPVDVQTVCFAVRFARVSPDVEPKVPRVFLVDEDGRHHVAASFGTALPDDWTVLHIPVASFGNLDRTKVLGWGVDRLPPLADVWLDRLTGMPADLAGDFFVRGGDGSIDGAGRIYVQGHRAWLRRDMRYRAQPDFRPRPPLPDPEPGTHHVAFLDVWDRTITARQDATLLEPALDDGETTARERQLAQVRVLRGVQDGDEPTYPPATGGGRLTTNVPAGQAEDRFPPEPSDPCRDRCLHTETTAAGDGYRGSVNLHMRVEIQQGGPDPVITWSRHNGSILLPLLQDAGPQSESLTLSTADASRLSPGSIITLGDRRTETQPAQHPTTLRVVHSVDSASGKVTLEPVGYELTPGLPAGGPPVRNYPVAAGAHLRLWDGADRLVVDVRYNLRDGITFLVEGAHFRPGDYWSFAVRVLDPDGAATGGVEQLDRSKVHGPVHHYLGLARIRAVDGQRVFEDIRPRFIPLDQVREALAELGDHEFVPRTFTLIVGDGVRSFGDIDQDLARGVTADEAITAAIRRVVEEGGGTIVIRAGDYTLAHPVVISGGVPLRILGEGAATHLRTVGAGGVFLVDRADGDHDLVIEHMRLEESPGDRIAIGSETTERSGDGLQPGDVEGIGTAEEAFEDALARNLLSASPERAMDAILETLAALRELQRVNPDATLEEIDDARPLLRLLRALPHGVVTLCDSTRVRLRNLEVVSTELTPESCGVFLTGELSQCTLEELRLQARSGLLALPLANFLSDAFVGDHPFSNLVLRGLSVEGNDVLGSPDADHGLLLLDGAYDQVRLTRNRVEGFERGIVLADHPLLDAQLEAVEVSHNQLVDTRILGIDVNCDHGTLIDNKIQMGSPVAQLQAGIRVRGSHVSLERCSVSLDVGSPSRPLHLFAGIVIGEGEEDLGVLPSPAFDIRVDDCVVRGTGHQEIGVYIGGPAPTIDIQVRGCRFLDLGDAAVRNNAHGGRVGGVEIVGNIVHRVATNPPTAGVQLQGWPVPTRGGSVPDEAPPTSAKAVLELLLDAEHDEWAPLIDGALRWLERHAARGAVVLESAVHAVVAENTLRAIGTDQLPVDEGECVAGVVGIGSRGLTIRDNTIQGVVGRAQDLDPEPPQIDPKPPASMIVLAEVLRRWAPTRPGDFDSGLTGMPRALERPTVLDQPGVSANAEANLLARAHLDVVDAAVSGRTPILDDPLLGELKALAESLEFLTTESRNRIQSALGDAQSGGAAEAMVLLGALSLAIAELRSSSAESKELWNSIAALERSGSTADALKKTWADHDLGFLRLLGIGSDADALRAEIRAVASARDPYSAAFSALQRLSELLAGRPLGPSRVYAALVAMHLDLYAGVAEPFRDDMVAGLRLAVARLTGSSDLSEELTDPWKLLAAKPTLATLHEPLVRLHEKLPTASLRATVVDLVAVAREASNPDTTEPAALDQAKSSIQRIDGLSADAKARLLSALSQGRNALLAAIAKALVALTGVAVPDVGPSPTPEPEVFHHQADGVFLAACAGVSTIRGNTIQDVTRGIVFGGGKAHLSVDGKATEPVELRLDHNNVVDCDYEGAVVEPAPPSTVQVAHNRFDRCARTRQSDAPLAGQAVLRLVGRGGLGLADNRVGASGPQKAPLFAVVVAWKGPVSIRDNTIEHHAGASGGAGLLLFCNDAPTDTGVARAALLGVTPFLEVDPLTSPQEPPPVAEQPLNTVELAAYEPGPPYKKAPERTPYQVLLDSLEDEAVVGMVPPPTQRPGYAIQGNQVTAAGPALLVLAAGCPGTVVGNTLQSAGSTGAVYVRNAAALTVASNRVVSAAAVTSLLIRMKDNMATVTGNHVLGVARLLTSQDELVATALRIVTGLRNHTTLAAAPLGALLAATFSLLMQRTAVADVPGILVTETAAGRLNDLIDPELELELLRTASLLIVGGTRVVATGNVTSSGAIATGAGQVLLSNL